MSTTGTRTQAREILIHSIFDNDLQPEHPAFQGREKSKFSTALSNSASHRSEMQQRIQSLDLASIAHPIAQADGRLHRVHDLTADRQSQST
jgi:hypothetical protein